MLVQCKVKPIPAVGIERPEGEATAVLAHLIVLEVVEGAQASMAESDYVHDWGEAVMLTVASNQVVEEAEEGAAGSRSFSVLDG